MASTRVSQPARKMNRRLRRGTEPGPAGGTGRQNPVESARPAGRPGFASAPVAKPPPDGGVPGAWGIATWAMASRVAIPQEDRARQPRSRRGVSGCRATAPLRHGLPGFFPHSRGPDRLSARRGAGSWRGTMGTGHGTWHRAAILTGSATSAAVSTQSENVPTFCKMRMSPFALRRRGAGLHPAAAWERILAALEWLERFVTIKSLFAFCFC